MRRTVVVLLTALLLGCGAAPEVATDTESLSSRGNRRGDGIALTGPVYYPEGVASAPDGTLYVGSIGTGAIVRIPVGSSSPEVFVQPRASFGNYGMAVDTARGVLWVCTYDDLLIPAQPAALTAYALRNGEVAASFVMPGPDGFCNDVVVDRQGNVYATDAFASWVVRLRAGASALETWATSPAFSAPPYTITLNGLVLDRSERNLYVVKSDTGTLFSIAVKPDGSAGEPVAIPVDVPLQLPDGLELLGPHTLLVVENGVTENDGRVSSLELAQGKAVRTILAQGLATPTTAALADGSAWVVEAQFNSASPVVPFRLARVPLRQGCGEE
jgi:sugar lactone lactonase YvrE